jgi:hypothetical protein
MTEGTLSAESAAPRGRALVRHHRGAILHTAMPMLCAFVEVGHKATGLTNGTGIERIPIRWLLTPRSSFLLFRPMVLWPVTHNRRSATLEHQRPQTIARFQKNSGCHLWCWRSPLHERLALRPSPLHEDSAPSTQAIEPKDRPSGTAQRSITLAASILRDAVPEGARQIRTRSKPIANGRLRWLVHAAAWGVIGRRHTGQA